MRRGFIITVVGFAFGMFASSLAFSQSSATWSGQAQCQLGMQTEVYAHQEVQTWTIPPGTQPTQQGAIAVYPASWTVTGAGTMQRPQGAQVLAGQWNSNVPSMNAPIAIFIRASDGRLIMKSFHSGLVAPGGVSGIRQFGGAQTSIVLAASEWQFPAIEDAGTSSNVSGSGTIVIAGTAMPMQVAGASGTGNCTWQFTKGGMDAGLANHTTLPSGPTRQIMGTSAISTANQASPAPAQISGSQARLKPAAVAMQGPPTSTLVAGAGSMTTAPPSTGVGSHMSSDVTGGAASAMATPTLPAPGSFTATNVGDGSVKFTWDAVSGSTRYRISGPGIVQTGLDITIASSKTITVRTALPVAPTAVVKNVPLGPGTWQIAAVDVHNVPSSQTSTTNAIVRYVPSHTSPWLIKNNGAGNVALTLAHYAAACPTCGVGATFGTVAVALGLPQNMIQTTCANANGYANCSPALTSDDQYGNQWNPEAVYSNVTEFGTTRTALCWNVNIPPGSPGLPPRVLCYSNSGNHGLTVIAKDMQYAWFMTFTSPGPNASIFDYTLTTDVTFDSEGVKHAPHACLSCHGGHWDANGARVTGATLLPLDPGMLQVSDTSVHMGLNFLGVNQAVASVLPSPAVTRYLTGLYGGDPRQVARQMKDDYGSVLWTNASGGGYAGNPWPVSDFIPAGWQQQSDLYKSAIKPYCMMCHLATPSNLDFSTYGNFAQNTSLINTEVCSGHTMPHAEYPFKQFWTKDTGNLFIPGYLAAALGITSCQ